MVKRFLKRVVLRGGIPQRQNYLPYQVSYLCRQINISWYTFQRSFRSVRDNQLLVTMETIVYMLVLDILDNQRVDLKLFIAVAQHEEKKMHTCFWWRLVLTICQQVLEISFWNLNFPSANCSVQHNKAIFLFTSLNVVKMTSLYRTVKESGVERANIT